MQQNSIMYAVGLLICPLAAYAAPIKHSASTVRQALPQYGLQTLTSTLNRVKTSQSSPFDLDVFRKTGQIQIVSSQTVQDSDCDDGSGDDGDRDAGDGGNGGDTGGNDPNNGSGNPPDTVPPSSFPYIPQTPPPANTPPQANQATYTETYNGWTETVTWTRSTNLVNGNWVDGAWGAPSIHGPTKNGHPDRSDCPPESDE